MTEEERQTLLQFVGGVYGQTKKMDQEIVGTSNNLKQTSEQIKNVFQQVLVQNRPPAPPPQIMQPPQQPVFVPPPDQVVVPANVNIPRPVDNNPLLVEISQKLDTIINILKENQNASKSKKTSTRKVSKLNSEDQRPVHTEG